MWRDRWLVLGVIGAALTCLACLTPALVLLLGGIGLGALLVAWTWSYFLCWLLSPGSPCTGTDRFGGESHETRFTGRGCGRLGWRPAVIALLSLAADRHRPRPRERRVHGGDDAIPMDLDPNGDPWRAGGLRPLHPGASPVRGARLPHGRQPDHPGSAGLGKPRRAHRHCVRPIP